MHRGLDNAGCAALTKLLQSASGDPWAEAAILGPLSTLYAYAGRFVDAHTAIARYKSTFCWAVLR
jgi:hypothetical protein